MLARTPVTWVSDCSRPVTANGNAHATASPGTSPSCSLAGHDHLKRLGVALVPTSAPDHFTEDTPTAILVRQVLGAIAQFDKATLVAKLKAARDRKRARTAKCGGRQSHLEARPDVVALARQLRRKRKGGQRSLREIRWRARTRRSPQ